MITELPQTGQEAVASSELVRPAIHYAIEYGSDGMPRRLDWSSEIQAEGERKRKQYEDERREQERQQRKPMAGLVEWAKARGLWA